jgi:hypothetical protein
MVRLARWLPGILRFATCPLGVSRRGGSNMGSAEDGRHLVKISLLEFGATLPKGGSFTGGNEQADALLRSDPFAFLMAACTDRLSPAEAVWETPWRLKQRLGELSPEKLSLMTPGQVEAILRELPRKPRFPYQTAKTIVSLSKLVSL